ncbi:DUF2384 domain-containing protein [Duganella sp. FT80W]|uniref:DUF2384 domain-containing protein n=1 Tax=Duganella guangzhouensis TaxID=2666084 RepID=A0A6I2L1Y5_9BURK|nr:antitoxin Xre/MbcA/ParS toxin-binding domain-containing protein [Duganella guangzhouensis]MRW91812.1 DUF2384 domain-containing protein [Duganella guangzhouensis]
MPTKDPASRVDGRPPAADSFSKLIARYATDRSGAIEAIRTGLPASLLKDAGQYFAVPTQRIRTILKLPETTAHSLIKRGALMDAAASERIWRLADLMHFAQEVFEDDEAAKNWLRTPSLTFLNVAPMDYLDTEPGAIAVRQVLNAIATGGVL